MKIRLLVLFTAASLLGLFLVGCGRFLVLNDPRKSEAIVILAGETDRRLTRGLELLDQGYAPHLILDVPAEAKIYQWNLTDLARKHVEELPESASIEICPVFGKSTRGEVQDVSRCLHGMPGKKILLVTSDYHTRRALSIFRRVAPTDYRIAAAFDEREFGTRWWQRREWVKTTVGEWAKFVWWEFVERWRHEGGVQS
jgi:hypothetical protein